MRQLAGFRTVGWAYNQRAVIATVETDAPHTTAWQRFLPTGPLALLPMGTSPPGPEPEPGSGSGSGSGSVRHYSNIVWSTTEEDAKLLQSMSDAAFISRLNAAFRTDYSPPPSPPSPPVSALGRTLAEALLPPSFAILLDSIGTGRKGLKKRGPKWKRGAFELPPLVIGVGSGRLSFPLRLSHSGKYVSERMALVGDSAHTVHPLAGQGVNLGLADADALVEVVGRGLATGRDIGEVRGCGGLGFSRVCLFFVIVVIFWVPFSCGPKKLNTRVWWFGVLHVIWKWRSQISIDGFLLFCVSLSIAI